MSLIPAFIACQIGQHDPKRRYVRQDGKDLVGQCRYCGKPIRRLAHKQWAEIAAKEKEAI